MAKLRPFQALRYDPTKVDLSRVIVPPYDVIAADERIAFYDRDPHNSIRLELTRKVEDEATTSYSDIRRTLDAWSESGVLFRDPEPAFYALRQSFTAPNGERESREGFFGLIQLEDYDRRVVRPHERTLAGPKADRLKVLRAARANLSSVFMLFEDRDDVLAGGIQQALRQTPLASALDETGITHELARIDAPDQMEAIQQFMAERPVVIADGHHRYETALEYRREQHAEGAAPDAGHEWMLVYLANAYAPGSLLLPIHRLVRECPAPAAKAWSEALGDWTQQTVQIPSEAAIPELLDQYLSPLADRPSFAADDASGTLRVFSRKASDSDELSVRVIHREVIEGVFGLSEEAVQDGAIAYPKSAQRTAADLRAGLGTVALYLNPLSPDDVFHVTGAGEVLPQKSTFFFPKLPTGLVFRSFE
ncbi:DUF1015 domain-containing protein [Myxococcota bacterium]|nr:DUF1015 domain-containing protein [Myxococcota bacterium]